MKQGKKFELLLLFVFVGLLALLGMTANVGAGRTDNTSLPISRQVVLRLIDHFADAECTAVSDDAQQESTSFEHPLPECWLVSEARTMLSKQVSNEQ